MRKHGILNPALMEAITRLGHTESILIADAGLPIPQHVECIDLSLTDGVPSFLHTLEAVMTELVTESTIIAKETAVYHADLYQNMRDLFGHQEEGISKKEGFFGTETKISGIGNKGEVVIHEEFKQLSNECRYVVRTGECSPYANIILIAGVSF